MPRDAITVIFELSPGMRAALERDVTRVRDQLQVRDLPAEDWSLVDSIKALFYAKLIEMIRYDSQTDTHLAAATGGRSHSAAEVNHEQ